MLTGTLRASSRRLFLRGGFLLPDYTACLSLSTAAETTKRSEVSPVVTSRTAQYFASACLAAVGGFAIYWGLTDGFASKESKTTFINWSHTHEVTPWQCFTPESQKEVEQIVASCQGKGYKLRVVGSGLSPNGIAFTNQTMVDMSLMDEVLYVDQKKRQIRVQCGARVEAVVEKLRPYGLTLQNFASIKEQQIGGFVQIGAHGTGARIPPVDEQVVSMKLVTPGMGTIELSKDDPDPTAFYIARVGLGSFGILTEVTIQCVPEHKLVERSFISSCNEVKKQHKKWMKQNEHLRYLWIPYTDTVVVVQCNPLTSLNNPKSTDSAYTSLEQTQAIRDLLETRMLSGRVGDYTSEQLEDLSFTQLRDIALAEDALNCDWVKKVNKAEAAYWKRAIGVRVDWSDRILGFDCGGQQWVLEVAFPSGTATNPSSTDLNFLAEVMDLIEKNKIPAPAPIEHRWSSKSHSYLSPAYSSTHDTVHAWVGIIHYLPTDDPRVRQNITKSFMEYARHIETTLLPKYNGSWHWGKLEIDRIDQSVMKKRLREKFRMQTIEAQRKKFDPENILENRVTKTIFEL